MKVSLERDRISEINRRLTILNLGIFLILIILVAIEEYGQNFFIRVSITQMGEHHKRHRLRAHQDAKTIIAPQIIVEPEPELRFPVNFMFGVSSSAYQTEGCLRKDGRTQSTWDVFVDDSIYGNATNSYQHYKHDVEAINQIGVSRQICWLLEILHLLFRVVSYFADIKGIVPILQDFNIVESDYTRWVVCKRSWNCALSQCD